MTELSADNVILSRTPDFSGKEAFESAKAKGNNMKRRLAAFLVVLQILFVFSSCVGKPSNGTETGENTTGGVPDDPSSVIFANGKTEYKVVRGAEASKAEIQCAIKLKTALVDASGIDFEISDDWVQKGEDATDRYEILVGNTVRPESAAELEKVGTDNGVIAFSGRKLVLNATDASMLQKVVDLFIETYLTGSVTTLTCASITSQVIETSQRAEYLGEEFIFRRADRRYGGGQFIAKLFTEGLGRGPEGSEYKEYADFIYTNMCTAETLAALAYKMFDSEEYKKLNLNNTEAAFAVYRAVLNRDPKQAEISGFDASKSADVAKELALGSEFSKMVKAINEGSYGWGVNNGTAYTGTNVMTSAEVNELLKTSSNVEIPQGTLVLCSEPIQLKPGQTLSTEGCPENYLKMARFLRLVKGSWSVIELAESNTTLKNVWIDGNRSNIGIDSGGNAWVCGSNVTVTSCKMSDTCGTTNMATTAVFTNVRVDHNLITCYTSTNTDNWTDGLTFQARGIVEYNTIIDATDVGIVLFRDWTDADQDTIVRYNKIISAGNSAFAALHVDAWFGEKEHSYEGACFYENELWTSMKTHFNLALSAASVAWHYEGNEAHGVAFYNNYTPEGLSVVCGVGIAVDGMKNATMRGNSMHVYIANIETDVFGTNLIMFNDKDYDGDVQKPYTDAPVHNSTTSYIIERINMITNRWTYREGIIHEDKVVIPEIYTKR